MPLSFDEFISILISQLTEPERQGSVAYAAERPLLAGSSVQFPGTRVEASSDSYVAFIDREPTANWGHTARYLVVSQESRESHSLDTRLPPFRSTEDMRWRVVYKGPSVPDAAVALPH